MTHLNAVWERVAPPSLGKIPPHKVCRALAKSSSTKDFTERIRVPNWPSSSPESGFDKEGPVIVRVACPGDFRFNENRTFQTAFRASCYTSHEQKFSSFYCFSQHFTAFHSFFDSRNEKKNLQYTFHCPRKDGFRVLQWIIMCPLLFLHRMGIILFCFGMINWFSTWFQFTYIFFSHFSFSYAVAVHLLVFCFMRYNQVVIEYLYVCVYIA